MTKDTNEQDEFGKKLLSPLISTPPLDTTAAGEIKQAYLLKAQTLSAAKSAANTDRKGLVWLFQNKSMAKILLAVFVAVVIFMVGSSITVTAAQSSLPGQALYKVKTWSEDVRLALAFSPQTRLSLVLKYTNRRIDEISSLVADGKTLDASDSLRFQQQLDDALQLAAQLNDAQITNALVQIKNHASNQGLVIQKLIDTAPSKDEPAIHNLRERLTEQVQISTIGEADPKEFRVRVRERLLQLKEKKHSNTTDEPGSLLPILTGTPSQNQNNGNHWNNKNKPTESPEIDNPGNGNHNPNPTHTPKP